MSNALGVDAWNSSTPWAPKSWHNRGGREAGALWLESNEEKEAGRCIWEGGGAKRVGEEWTRKEEVCGKWRIEQDAYDGNECMLSGMIFRYFLLPIVKHVTHPYTPCAAL